MTNAQKIQNEPSLDEFMEEHVAEKQEQERKEEAARCAEYRKRDEERRQALVVRDLPIVNKIAGAINAKGETIAFVDDDANISITVNGVVIDTKFWLTINEECDHYSSWHSKPNGKLRVVVGSYGGRKSYPQRKDGTHNYAAIGDELLLRVGRQLKRDMAEGMCESNRPGVDKLRKELGLEAHYGPMTVQPSSDPNAPVFVHVDFKRAMTYSDAVALHATLKSLGYVK